ncbi:preprotein translocase subunit SecE [Luteococcus sp. H138]|uniref:preprotein translocase subunit SecE n=1 Tax=unclassified Luteococcus TaxID=2639923 RepID=UPI00313F1A1C
MADDQTRKSFDDAENESDQQSFDQDPAGDQLSRPARDLPAGEIVDDEAEELSGEDVEDSTPDHADPQDMVIDDPEQLAAAEAVAARARSSRPVRRKRDVQPQPEQPAETETPAQAPRANMPKPVRKSQAKQPAEQAESQETAVAARRAPVRKTQAKSSAAAGVAVKRTTPAGFVGQSVDELRKVIWPTSSQLSQYFVVVLLFVLFIVAYVGLLDPAFGWVLLKFLGK